MRPITTAVRGESDTLEVSVIVDETGVPLLGTAHVGRAPERAIAIRFLDWFCASRFVPGHIQHCAVRSLVRLKGTITIEDQFLPAF